MSMDCTLWNPENAQQLHECMLVNQDSLSACVHNIADVNETIHSLTPTIKSITDKFCTKKRILILTCVNSAN